MWLVHLALRRPGTIITAVAAILILAGYSLQRMKTDIFPQLGAPTIYVAQPYGGMDPSQMEGYLTYYFEYHFLYITGIAHVESKNIQGAALMKLQFHPGTDMANAMAQVIGYVNRSRAFMPAGAVPPFVTRFDAGSYPVGQLVFNGPNRTPGELQDFALNRVRPLFATLPGVSAPPPFGGNQRTILVRLDPDKLRQYRVSPEEAISAVNQASAVLPSGNVRTGDLNRFAVTNSAIGGNLHELADAPVRTGAGANVYIRDLGVVENGTDILTGYAHVNGKRTVYIPVTKRADASTLDVLEQVRKNLPKMQAVLPEDVTVSLEFEQSGYVREAIRSLVQEGLLGAVLTALVVLLFLRDWRSALIVAVNIPVALLASLIALYLSGQTLNIMTLGGLALAVGVLVDEATVEIENIHARLRPGLSRVQVVLEACRRTAAARLLSMLCILSVFLSAAFMTGAGAQLFIPLSLAVGFAMVASYVLSSTLVPVLSGWFLRRGSEDHQGPWRTAYGRAVAALIPARFAILGVYAICLVAAVFLIGPSLGVEFFPEADAGQHRVRLRAATGTRIERTEEIALQALKIIEREARGLRISTGFIGVQPASYPVNTIFLFTSGPHEAVLSFAVKDPVRTPAGPLRERIRAAIAREMPAVKASFEPGDLISDVMSFGAPTPVEVAVQSPALPASRAHAAKVESELRKIPYLRDLQYAQAFDYPSLQIHIDRERAGQYGLTASRIARSVVAATSSSRFIDANYWRDPNSGNAFQIQVEIPQNRIASADDLRQLPVMDGGAAWPLLGDVATIQNGVAPGLVERFDGQRVVSLTANLVGIPLGRAAELVQDAVRRAGEPPKGVTVSLRGQIPPLQTTIRSLQIGLLASVGVVFLLLSANFQSIRLALTVMATVPAVLAGVVAMLALTGTTVNVQSFIGSIMAVGIAVANSILLVTFSEDERRRGQTLRQAAIDGAQGRVRAVIMTALAMIAGMTPMALASGAAASQAPLARAVIGGLLAATVTTLFVIPCVYMTLQRNRDWESPSLDPTDPESRHFDPAFALQSDLQSGLQPGRLS
jgi:multidrug efflux pump subunit AcrB